MIGQPGVMWEGGAGWRGWMFDPISGNATTNAKTA